MTEQTKTRRNLVEEVRQAVQELQESKGSTFKSIQSFLKTHSPHCAPTDRAVQSAIKEAVEKNILHVTKDQRFKDCTDCGCGGRHGRSRRHSRRRRSGRRRSTRRHSGRRSGRRGRKGRRSLCKGRRTSRRRSHRRRRSRGCRRRCTRMWTPKRNRSRRRGRCHSEKKIEVVDCVSDKIEIKTEKS